MKKVQLLKVIALILSLIIMFPLFACDNGGNNDESNNPPEPPKQTVFHDEQVISEIFVAYEEFDNIEDASKYVKTWRKDYEIYIPKIEDADSFKISVTTYRPNAEKERFKHFVSFVYEKAEPYYKLKGTTTTYIENRFDKTNFHLALNGAIDLETTDYIEYNYNDNGKIVATYDYVNYKYYKFGIKNENFVLMTGGLYLQNEQEKTYSEIKTLIFDNLVPLSEQKNQEIEEKFDFRVHDGDMTGSVPRQKQHEYFNSLKKDVESLGKKYNISCFALSTKGFYERRHTTKYRIWPYSEIDYLSHFLSGISFIEEVETKNTNNDSVYISVKPIITPNSLIQDDNSYTITFSSEIKEFNDSEIVRYRPDGSPIVEYYTRYGYEFTVKNQNGIVMTGNVRAEESNSIDLEEIEQKILSNIILIKGE